MTRIQRLDQLLEPLGIQAPALRIEGMALDSRALRQGDLFVALQGEREHGLRHLESALGKGAAAVLVERVPGLSLPQCAVPLVLVDTLRSRLGLLADRCYGAPSAALDVVGVTGTNGKTSTVQFIAEAIEHLGGCSATQGTLGAGLRGALKAGERTTPDVLSTHRLLREVLDAGADTVAMEVSSHALVQGRVDGVRFDVAVYTNLTRDHLDYHGTMDAYFAAKASLFDWAELGAAVINLDDAHGRRLWQACRSRVPSFGYSAAAAPEARVRAQALELGPAGMRFELVLDEQLFHIASPLLGRFNLANLLACAASLRALEYAPAEVAAAMSALTPVLGRMNRLGGGAQPLVVVDYAHTPDAIEKALSALREHCPGRLTIVFGCGGERDRGKRPEMARSAEAGADRVWLTDDNPRGEDGDQIVADALAGFLTPAKVQVQRDRARAIETAIREATAGDVVLIAGKGHEPYQEVAGRKLPFVDHEVAQQALARYAA